MWKVEKMVEVFKTNIYKLKQAKQVLAVLSVHFPAHKINIDLKDCDRVLRVEGSYVSCEIIISLLQALDYECQALE